MVNYVVTGVCVMDGYANVWVVGLSPDRLHADGLIKEDEEKFFEDYGKTPEQAGVEYEVHKV